MQLLVVKYSGKSNIVGATSVALGELIRPYSRHGIYTYSPSKTHVRHIKTPYPVLILVSS
jgi:hypothetical protein